MVRLPVRKGCNEARSEEVLMPRQKAPAQRIRRILATEALPGSSGRPIVKNATQAIVAPLQPLVTASCYCGASTVAYRVGCPHSEERAAINAAKDGCTKCRRGI